MWDAWNYLFCCNGSSAVAHIATLDDIDDFPHVYMDRMLTLDFEVLASAARVEWSEKTPVLFDEEGGWAVFKINESGLRWTSSATLPMLVMSTQTTFANWRSLCEAMVTQPSTNLRRSSEAEGQAFAVWIAQPPAPSATG